MGDEREIDVLSKDECYQLIVTRAVGRMGVIAEGVQVIHPVNYATDGQSVVVKVNPYSVLAVSAPLAQVAFEVDQIDEEQHVGWSVLLQGIAHDVTDTIDPTSEALRKLAVSPWAPGDKSCWLKITPRDVSGRRIRPTKEKQR